jgi:hypothetical protein
MASPSARGAVGPRVALGWEGGLISKRAIWQDAATRGSGWAEISQEAPAAQWSGRVWPGLAGSGLVTLEWCGTVRVGLSLAWSGVGWAWTVARSARGSS